uniref:Uncharacterized protein n=1 Tax=Glossina austeni TaxID=7395 RepID=A0A1A9UTE3_GLOAU
MRKKLRRCRLDTGDIMETLNNEESYKFLGFLQLKGALVQEMKAKIRSVFEKRLVTILKTKVNSKCKCKAINTWAIRLLFRSSEIERHGPRSSEQDNRNHHVQVQCGSVPKDEPTTPTEREFPAVS